MDLNNTAAAAAETPGNDDGGRDSGALAIIFVSVWGQVRSVGKDPKKISFISGTNPAPQGEPLLRRLFFVDAILEYCRRAGGNWKTGMAELA